MGVTGSQQQTFLRLLAALRSHWRTDVHLPARIQALLSRNRAFGSRDRRLYRELIYTTLRYLPWIEPLPGAGCNEGRGNHRVAGRRASGDPGFSRRTSYELAALPSVRC